jgi:hypothetical protein
MLGMCSAFVPDDSKLLHPSSLQFLKPSPCTLSLLPCPPPPPLPSLPSPLLVSFTHPACQVHQETWTSLQLHLPPDKTPQASPFPSHTLSPSVLMMPITARSATIHGPLPLSIICSVSPRTYIPLCWLNSSSLKSQRFPRLVFKAALVSTILLVPLLLPGFHSSHVCSVLFTITVLALFSVSGT